MRDGWAQLLAANQEEAGALRIASTEAMRKTAARAKGKPQIEAAIKAAQTEAVASGHSTLFGRLHRYAEMRKTIALPKTGLTLEQARAAALLFSTLETRRINCRRLD